MVYCMFEHQIFIQIFYLQKNIHCSEKFHLSEKLIVPPIYYLKRVLPMAAVKPMVMYFIHPKNQFNFYANNIYQLFSFVQQFKTL